MGDIATATPNRFLPRFRRWMRRVDDAGKGDNFAASAAIDPSLLARPAKLTPGFGHPRPIFPAHFALALMTRPAAEIARPFHAPSSPREPLSGCLEHGRQPPLVVPVRSSPGQGRFVGTVPGAAVGELTVDDDAWHAADAATTRRVGR